jgi:DNA-binding response OmpR family regulator/drug/metabolite transporter (DMT)-like permease
LPSEPATGSIDRPDAPTGRILIVDDSKTQLLKISSAVRKLGHEVLTCEDGASALEIAASGKVDVMLLDLVMPGLDGFGVLERMKKDPHLCEVPVIVISALDGDMESVAKAIELGAIDFLSKDFSPIVLKARIRAGLERKRVRDIEIDYLRHVAKLTRVAAVLETGTFNPRTLNIQDVAKREDGLGTLAGVLMTMAQKIYEREQAFRNTIATLRGSILLLVIGCLYGLQTPLSRLASFSDVSPWLLSFWMNFLGASILLAYALRRGRPGNAGRRDWAIMIVAGVIGALAEVLLFSAAAELPASTVTMILAMDSFIVFAIVTLLGYEKGDLRRFLGLTLGSSAVMIIVVSGSQMPGGGSLVWYLVALSVPALYALDYILIAEKLPNHLDFSFMAGCIMAISAVATLPLVLWSGELAATGQIIADTSLLSIILLLTAIATLATVLTFVLTKSTGAVFASQCSYAVTFFGIAWSVILLQERLDVWTWIALALVVLGMVIVGPKKAAEPEPPEGLEPA